MTSHPFNCITRIAGLSVMACLGFIPVNACAAGYWYQITPPVQYVAGQPKVLLRASLNEWVLEQSSSFVSEQECMASRAARTASSQQAYMQAKDGYDRASRSNVAQRELSAAREMAERANVYSIRWNSSRCIRIDDPRIKK